MKELSLMEMQQIVGGVSRKEYCDTLIMLMAGDTDRKDFEEYRKKDVYFQKYCA